MTTPSAFNTRTVYAPSHSRAAQQRAKELERNVEALRTANFVLTQRLEDAREQLTARQSETSQWANSMEADAERHFNVSAAATPPSILSLTRITCALHLKQVLTRNPAGAAAAASEGRRRASSVEGVLTPLGASTRCPQPSCPPPPSPS